MAMKRKACIWLDVLESVRLHEEHEDENWVKRRGSGGSRGAEGSATQSSETADPLSNEREHREREKTRLTWNGERGRRHLGCCGQQFSTPLGDSNIPFTGSHRTSGVLLIRYLHYDSEQ